MDDFGFNDIHMSKSHLRNPRKRKYTKPTSSQQHEALDPQAKRHKPASHETEPPILTKDALKELNRRNNPRTSKSIYRARRPVTRTFRAELNRIRNITQPAHAFITSCVPDTLKDIKLFARHGGPDLSHLRGVGGVLLLTCLN